MHQFTADLPNDGLEHLDVSLCVEWLKVNAPIGSLTEDNLEHCAVALRNSLGDTRWWERPIAVSTASSWQPVAERYALGREGLERRGGGGVGQFANRIFMSQADKWCYDSK